MGLQGDRRVSYGTGCGVPTDRSTARQTDMAALCGSLFAEMQSFDGAMACVIYAMHLSARNAGPGIAPLAYNSPTLDTLKCGKSPASWPDLRFRLALDAWTEVTRWISPASDTEMPGILPASPTPRQTPGGR